MLAFTLRSIQNPGLILRSGAFAASRRMAMALHQLMVRDGAEVAPPHHEVLS